MAAAQFQRCHPIMTNSKECHYSFYVEFLGEPGQAQIAAIRDSLRSIHTIGGKHFKLDGSKINAPQDWGNDKWAVDVYDLTVNGNPVTVEQRAAVADSVTAKLERATTITM